MNCRLLLHLIKERLSFLQGCIDQHHSASIDMFVHCGRHLLRIISQHPSRVVVDLVEGLVDLVALVEGFGVVGVQPRSEGAFSGLMRWLRAGGSAEGDDGVNAIC